MPKRQPSGEAVVVAMSGGVDSSTAAALLLREGFRTIGLTLRLFDPPGEGCPSEGRPSCCGSGARLDAAAVAAALGIPLYTADLRRSFERAVVADFTAEYRRGRTPNPCVRCNRFVKFGPLLRRARALGAERMATGHYARTDFDPSSGRWRLRKGLDPVKDQSYFLFALRQDVLSRTLFPVGGLTKPEVRELASRFGLPTARKGESQEICFVPGDDYARFLRARIPDVFRTGSIVDAGGREIGRHDGLPNYTIGQRKGMGIAVRRPLYVVALDPETNTVIAGESGQLFRKRLLVKDVNWVALPGLEGPREAAVKIRSRHEEAAALLIPAIGGAVTVEFAAPQRAVTPGQAAVFYDGDVVLGGGTIDRVLE